MATEVSAYSRDVQPYSCIGLVWVTFPDGTEFRGTCTLVGRNDILTATHMVYSPDNGGWATDYDFYFGADYNDITDRFTDYGYEYSPTKWNVFGWPNQAFTDSNNETMLQSETQYDLALIGVNTAIGDTLGWLELNSGYNGSYTAKAVGYPAGATGMMQEDVFVRKDSHYNLYESKYNVMGPGSSGGPLLVGDYVVGVKSTGSWWADIGLLYGDLTDEMDANNSLLSSIADTTAPTVVSFNPSDEATGVAVGSDIVLTFSEAIQWGTGNIVLKTAAGTTFATYDAATSNNLSISGSTLTINPSVDLAAGTGYKVEFAPGTINDFAGNFYAGTISYNFTTTQVTIPIGSHWATITYNTAGSETITGGDGIDLIVFVGTRNQYTISGLASSAQVTGSLEGDTDTLVGIERLQFSDVFVALDLDDHAGITAKTLGAVFGEDSVANKDYVGICLHYLDESGYSYEQLMQLAIDARLGAGATHSAVVDLLYTNVVGVAPSPEDLDYFVGLLDNGSFTVASLGVLAADTDLNQSNIDLVGLRQAGLEYVPFS